MASFAWTMSYSIPCLQSACETLATHQSRNQHVKHLPAIVDLRNQLHWLWRWIAWHLQSQWIPRQNRQAWILTHWHMQRALNQTFVVWWFHLVGKQLHLQTSFHSVCRDVNCEFASNVAIRVLSTWALIWGSPLLLCPSLVFKCSIMGLNRSSTAFGSL